jgi:predicted Zn-dependent protease
MTFKFSAMRAHTAAGSTRLLQNILAVGLAGALLAGCQTVQTTEAGQVGVKRSQLMGVSATEINAASEQSYRKMLQEAEQKKQLNRDAVMLARVRGIATKLVKQTGHFRADAADWKWETNVFHSEEVNAFCMAGGKIGIYSGLIEKLQITDEELAIVTGNQALADLGDMVSSMTLTLPKSREAEREADVIGVELAARAGYDPRAAISLWQKMNRLGGSRPPEFLSTHPNPESRQQELESITELVMPLYEQSRRR